MLKRKSDHLTASAYFYAAFIVGSIFLLTLAGVLSKEISKIFLFHHALLSVLLILGLTAFVAGGLLLFIHQVFLSLRLLRNLNKSSIRSSSSIQKVLHSLGLQKRVYLIKDERKFCFTAGVISPKIFVSSTMIEGLTKKEFTALLLHELYHLQNRDPLKILFCRILQKVFFFLPILKQLIVNYEISRELAADSCAVEKAGSSKHLATLFVKTISSKQEDSAFRPSPLAANFDEGLNQRLAKLVGKRTQVGPPILRPLLLSLLIFALLLYLPRFSTDILHSPLEPMSFSNMPH